MKWFGEDDIAVRDYLHSMEEKGDIFNMSDMQYMDEEKENITDQWYVFTSKKKTGTRNIVFTHSTDVVLIYKCVWKYRNG